MWPPYTFLGIMIVRYHATAKLSPFMSTPAWTALERHFQAMKDVHMRSLFEKEPARFDQYSLQVGDILLDYSKNRTTAETMQLLTALAAEAGVCEKRDAMFSGAWHPPFRACPVPPAPSSPAWAPDSSLLGGITSARTCILEATTPLGLRGPSAGPGRAAIWTHARLVAAYLYCTCTINLQASLSTRRRTALCSTSPCGTARTGRSK